MSDGEVKKGTDGKDTLSAQFNASPEQPVKKLGELVVPRESHRAGIRDVIHHSAACQT